MISSPDWCDLVGAPSCNQVVGSIPGQATYLGCGLGTVQVQMHVTPGLSLGED